MTAPIDTIAEARLVVAVLVVEAAACAPAPSGLPFDGASSARRARAKPTPEAAVRARIASAAKAAPNAAMPQVEPGDRRRGRASRASPTTPPRPVGSGQLPGAGSSEARAAAAATPDEIKARLAARRARAAARSGAASPRRPAATSAAMQARPSICMTMSAAIAPGAPRRLWIGALVAWLRLGSSTDQVSSATPRPATPASATTPSISAARRFGNSRTDAGR